MKLPEWFDEKKFNQLVFATINITIIACKIDQKMLRDSVCYDKKKIPTEDKAY